MNVTMKRTRIRSSSIIIISIIISIIIIIIIISSSIIIVIVIVIIIIILLFLLLFLIIIIILILIILILIMTIIMLTVTISVPSVGLMPPVGTSAMDFSSGSRSKPSVKNTSSAFISRMSSFMNCFIMILFLKFPVVPCARQIHRLKGEITSSVRAGAWRFRFQSLRLPPPPTCFFLYTTWFGPRGFAAAYSPFTFTVQTFVQG